MLTARFSSLQRRQREIGEEWDRVNYFEFHVGAPLHRGGLLKGAKIYDVIPATLLRHDEVVFKSTLLLKTGFTTQSTVGTHLNLAPVASGAWEST